MIAALFALWIWTNAVNEIQWSPAQPSGGWIDGSLHQANSAPLKPNPAFSRYWWLYSIANRYGLTLPCDIAALRLAMYQATTPENTAGIALDAADAIACFFGNGGTAADWSVVPPETIQ